MITQNNCVDWFFLCFNHLYSDFMYVQSCITRHAFYRLMEKLRKQLQLQPELICDRASEHNCKRGVALFTVSEGSLIESCKSWALIFHERWWETNFY